MSKRLILILSLAFVVGIAAYAYAEVQNVKVSGDLTIRAISRRNLDLQSGRANAGTYDSTLATTRDEGDWLMSTVRLKVDADLTDNVVATVRLLNERDWDGEGTSTPTGTGTAADDIDLDLAYIALREFFNPAMTLTLGRQELRFGNGMIIGDPDGVTLCQRYAAGSAWGNITAMDLSSRKGFDALRATLDLKPWVIDAFYAKLDEGNVNISDDVDLYGVNARYDFGVKRAIGELYLFVKDTGARSSLAASKAARIYNLGGRTSVGPTEEFPLMLQAELAHQMGNVSGVTGDTDSLMNGFTTGSSAHQPGRRNAWATMLSATMLLPPREAPSSLTLAYGYFSGDKKLDGDYKVWSTMYYDLGYGPVDSALLGPSNIQSISLVGTYKIMPDLDSKLRYSHYMWDKTPLAGSTLAGVYNVAYLQRGKRDVGDMLDLNLTYAYTEDVSFELNTGVFFPGSTFDKSNDSNLSQIMGTMKVTF